MRKPTKREQAIDKRATQRLYDLIRNALVSDTHVDTYDDTNEPNSITVDMSDDDACYVGPFVITIALRPTPAAGD